MGWVSIEERRPTESGAYYVAQKGRVFVFHYDVAEDLWHDGDLENLLGLVPDHWMPRPEFPTEKVYILENQGTKLINFDVDSLLEAIRYELEQSDEIKDNSELETYEFKIYPMMLTKEQIDNTPEFEGF